MFILLAVTGQALAAPPDPVALIQAKQAKAIADMDTVVSRYEQYLEGSPSLDEAKAERDVALADIARIAQKARTDIQAEMLKHPTDPAVQQAGLEALAAVTNYETSASSSVRNAYDAYASGSTTTTTTTTLIQLPPPLPPLTTTTSTTLPPVLPSPTTTTTTTQSNATTTPGEVPPSTTSTTVVGGSQPVDRPEPPVGAPADTGTEAGSGISIALSAALPAASGQPATSGSPAQPAAGTDLGDMVEFLRLRLPPAFADPMVDFMIILRAVIAAFTSGIATMKWPVGAMSVGFLIQQGARRFRS